MALSQTITTTFGITVNDAYHRVEGVRLTSKDVIAFQCRAYVDASKPHIADTEHTCSHDLDGPNPIRQAYLHLKTLPEFANATDC
jgi:hypothetical protein